MVTMVCSCTGRKFFIERRGDTGPVGRGLRARVEDDSGEDEVTRQRIGFVSRGRRSRVFRDELIKCDLTCSIYHILLGFHILFLYD